MSTAVLEKLEQMDRAYQADRQALLTQIAQNEREEQAAAEALAAKMGYDRQQKRVQAIVAHFDENVRPTHEKRFLGLAAQCGEFRQVIQGHVDAILAALEALPDLQSEIESAIDDAANDAYVRHMSETGDRDQAWLLSQDWVNGDVAGIHDLRTAVAVLPIIERLCDLQLSEGITVASSSQYGKAPAELAGIDVTGIADGWIAKG